MIFTETLLKDSYVVDLEPIEDERGWFARTFDKVEFAKIGQGKEWLQMNHSYTRHRGTIRGMHFQRPPFREVKLVRCIAGAVYDVIVDLRNGSSTLLKHVGVELSAANKRMICIPEGFAHGFQALTDDCELIYHHTEMYTPDAEGGIRYNEPVLDIAWPLAVSVISERDKKHPALEPNFKGL